MVKGKLARSDTRRHPRGLALTWTRRICSRLNKEKLNIQFLRAIVFNDEFKLTSQCAVEIVVFFCAFGLRSM